MENNNVEVKEIKEEKKKEPMTTKQKVFLGLRIAFNVVFYALIIFLFLFSIMNIRGGNGTTNFPNIFGKGFLSVQSDSMKRDPNGTIYPEWNTYKIGGFETGDLVNVDVFNPNDAKNLKVGDVITFQDKINGQAALNTHRIVEINKNGDEVIGIITQGDRIAQTTPYSSLSDVEKLTNQTGVYEAVQVSQIRGVVTGVNSGAGKVLDNIQKNWLFIFVIPIIALLVVEVFLVIRNIMLLRGEKNKLELADTKEAMLAEVEAEKEKMRQELLAELRAQGLAPAEETKSEDSDKQEEKIEDEKTELENEETKTEDNSSNEEVKIEESKEDTSSDVNEVKEEIVEEKVEESTDKKDE